MKKYIYLIACLTVLTLMPLKKGYTAPFIAGFEDVPLMEGMTQISKDTISFGNEESRFVEAYITGESTSFQEVADFYVKTLPQLGWNYQGQRDHALLFYRESELLEIAQEIASPLEVRITVKSKL